MSGSGRREGVDGPAAAIDPDERAALGRPKRGEPRRQTVPSSGSSLLMLMRKRLSGKAARTSSSVGIRPTPLPRKGKVLAAVGGVAIADVERLQLGQRVVAGDAVAVGAAVERPVVEDDEMAVGGRVNVELDHVGAGGEGRAEAGDGVLQIMDAPAGRCAPPCRSCRSALRDGRSGRAPRWAMISGLPTGAGASKFVLSKKTTAPSEEKSERKAAGDAEERAHGKSPTERCPVPRNAVKRWASLVSPAGGPSFCRSIIQPGYSGGSALTSSRVASSSAASVTSAAAMLSSSCSIVRAPTITVVTKGWCSSQARAIRATETPCASAIGRMASMQAKARSLSTGGKSKVTRREPSGPLPSRSYLPRQQPAGERAPDHQPDPLVLQQRRDLALEVAAGDGVVGLQRGEARPAVAVGDAERLHDLPGRPVRAADIADMALAHEVLERAHGLLDRRRAGRGRGSGRGRYSRCRAASGSP